MAGEREAMAKHEDKDILNGAPLQHDEGEAQGDSNRNFINKKDMPLANARGLVDLPPELKLLILEPLEFGTLLQVEKCHESFETLGHQLKLQRADGKVLNIRADDDSIVLQIPGGARRFLDRNDTYCQAPDF
ncbi:unnamed protein product, partial [Mesorhabditis spiculigera]